MQLLLNTEYAALRAHRLQSFEQHQEQQHRQHQQHSAVALVCARYDLLLRCCGYTALRSHVYGCKLYVPSAGHAQHGQADRRGRSKHHPVSSEHSDLLPITVHHAHRKVRAQQPGASMQYDSYEPPSVSMVWSAVSAVPAVRCVYYAGHVFSHWRVCNLNTDVFVWTWPTCACLCVRECAPCIHQVSFGNTGCMWMNSSRDDNPGFWETSPLVRLHNVGYTTGMFGKVLNNMDSYGCDGKSGLPPGVDRQVVMCTHTFFDCDWVNDTVLTHTGSAPEDYTTSVMGNASVTWIKSVLDKGKTHPPFFAWIGPHAPHLPSTPAPWYAEHPIGNLKAPTADPPYNFSGVDHHPLVAGQPILDARNTKKACTLAHLPGDARGC